MMPTNSNGEEFITVGTKLRCGDVIRLSAEDVKEVHLVVITVRGDTIYNVYDGNCEECSISQAILNVYNPFEYGEYAIFENDALSLNNGWSVHPGVYKSLNVPVPEKLISAFESYYGIVVRR